MFMSVVQLRSGNILDSRDSNRFLLVKFACLGRRYRMHALDYFAGFIQVFLREIVRLLEVHPVVPIA